MRLKLLFPLVVIAWTAPLFAADSLAIGHPAAPFEDSIAQRALACTTCHGPLGRAGPDGYYPRLAGKPAPYLYKQLLDFRDGRRHYPLMASLLEPLDDAYLLELASYFATLQVPYPAPASPTLPPADAARARQLADGGDAARRLPACSACHGATLSGNGQDVPSLLGLPRDYLAAQLGSWRNGQRHGGILGQQPDCMGEVARRMSPQDVALMAAWLSSQPAAQAHAAQPPASTSPTAPARDTLGLTCFKLAAPSASPSALEASAAATSDVARGAYLARAGNCMACHTAQGGRPYAGGRAIATPFGAVVSSNLTADAATGLGRWSKDDFWQALHHGKSRDGRLLLPAFPYTSYTLVTRADSDALFAYLQSLPGVANTPPPHQLRWPFNTQWALAAWRAWYFSPGEFKATADKTPEWNRGAYLVQGLGHCSSCHAERNALGASSNAAGLQGGLIPMQNWYAPSLASNAQAGVGHWREADIVTLLRTGTAPGATVQGPMAEVVRGSTQHLSQADLQAMAIYLKDLSGPTAADSTHSATATAPAAATNPPPAGRGAKLYEQHCAHCHGRAGEGVPGAYVPLAGNRAVTLPVATNLAQTVMHGGFAPATAGNPRPYGMPPFLLVLDDADIAAVLSFVRGSWGNRAGPVTELDVGQVRSATRR